MRTRNHGMEHYEMIRETEKKWEVAKERRERKRKEEGKYMDLWNGKEGGEKWAGKKGRIK